MLLHIERDVYEKAFGKLIFSNSKLDVYTREGKLCSVNRDLLLFFSPLIKQLLKDVPEGIRPSLVLPDVSLECLQHVFKVISNGFTDFARIQDLKDAGDVLGINLDCLEYVENNAGKDLARSETKKKSEISTLDINKIKKEIIDVVVIKKEASEEVVTNLVSEEISLHLQAKKYDAGVGSVGKSNCHNKDLRDIHAVECADKTPHTTHPVPTVGAYKKYQSPARIRRSIRRALMHKAMNEEKDGDSKLDKIADNSTNKVEISKSLRKPSFKCRSSPYTDEQSSQMYQWENTTYKSKIHGNRKSTWQAKRSEYAEYKKSNPRDSWKSRRDERMGELSRKATEMSRSPLVRNREQNPFYAPEEGEIE